MAWGSRTSARRGSRRSRSGWARRRWSRSNPRDAGSARMPAAKWWGRVLRPMTSRSSCAPMSVMPAPIRRWWSRAFASAAGQRTVGPSLAALKAAFEAAHRAQFGFVDETKALVVEAVSIEAIGGGAKFSEPVLAVTAAPLPGPAQRTRFYSGGAWREAAVYTRDQLAPGHKVPGPAIIIEPHQTVVVEDGWQAEVTAKNHLVLARSGAARARPRRRHQGRSRHARGLQQPLHVDRRADGRRAAEHRLFRQHQGTARLLLRGVRP